MYSYGSSARVGVGKQGHGGRKYRPPPKQKDPTQLVPPPLKECDCLIELEVPEYASPQPRRLHLSFDGSTLVERQATVKDLERTLRSKFGVHLHLPGRNQHGPVAVMGKSFRECIPATVVLLNRLVRTNPQRSVDTAAPFVVWNGRISKNVKDPSERVISGRFRQRDDSSNFPTEPNVVQQLDPYWLFESDHWKILVCPLVSGNNREQEAIAEGLRTTMDNLLFRLGTAALAKLHIVLYEPPPPSLDQRGENTISPMAFVIGDPSETAATMTCLYDEIKNTRITIDDDSKEA